MEHNRMLEGIESHSVLGMVSDGLPVRINLDLPYNILLPGRDEWERTALKALGSYRCTSKAVWNCQQTLSRVGRTNRLTLVWIPGHVGLKGNEVADSLARRGATLEFIGPEPVLGLSYTTARSVIRTWAEGDTLQYWRGLPGLTHSKRFIPSPSKARSKKLLELSRINLRALVGLYTGHCRLRRHIHRIGLAEDAKCRLCMEDDETAEHDFLANGELIFQSKKTGDYHEEMNGDVDEKWFGRFFRIWNQDLLLLWITRLTIAENVKQHLYNHGGKQEFRNGYVTKESLLKRTYLKAELLKIVKIHAHKFKKLRLPPYHCELNPIELIWAQIKGERGRENRTFKLADIERHLRRAIENVRSEDSKKCINHVVKEEQKMWDVDFMFDQTIEPIAISVGNGRKPVEVCESF
ncbi:hypothetical protein NQ315_014799 [Exocentrus adspersus]|uniref:RNase H type-1 domain-containing protein n=1 Tax=Exocentrus adspersus TaxID=1586481 RepID=A0AAV8VMZ7_9CUCU|nr:hypothetical protein NQ315_014799 [Exocentrus adspersus]